ncbi:NAD(P)-dependent oxidoreductase [Labrys sedimenti]|uniref:NAD(P)-dependent oxidoreductase n=1 Tax=Labrys sedimenti TaxID=3106036 RepID=UPI002ACA7A9A|nr:NAD(P)-dependent oxidoreductase [Labrys sp. ZIDIC5]MDZ5452428.1 NAD(P)-dependent oxidoreductase [Labrys sp. ZIDIC5]
MERILVTPRSLTSAAHPLVERLRKQGHEIVMPAPGKLPDEEDLLALVPGVTGWLAGVERISPRVIAAAGSLRAISRNGTGTDNLPIDTLLARKIAVRIAAGANAAGVAELAIGLIFAALRQIPLCDAGIKQGAWPRRIGAEIRGRKVGVVGCGAIGAEVARLAAALGAEILAYDPQSPAVNVEASSLRWVEISDMLAEADIVTLHCPAPADGRPLLGTAEFAAMRRGAVLVNTARSSLVDEAALLQALEDGRLGCYAADVFEEEPPANLVLAGHARVIATSHIGGFTQESVDRATEVAIANLMDALQGRA